MLIVELVCLRHYRGDEMNERIIADRAQDIANIDVILGQCIIVYVERSRYNKNI